MTSTFLEAKASNARLHIKMQSNHSDVGCEKSLHLLDVYHNPTTGNVILSHAYTGLVFPETHPRTNYDFADSINAAVRFLTL